MTILHKCSKTHGHYLVLLVTSRLRLKAESVTGSAGRAFGVFPGPRLHTTKPRRARRSCGDKAFRSPDGGAGHCPRNTLRALYTGPFFTGRPRWVSAGDGWLPGTSPLPAPSKAPLRSLLCLSQRPLVLDGFGGSDVVQGRARDGQQQGLCLGAKRWVTDMTGKGKGWVGTLPGPVTLFLDKLSAHLRPNPSIPHDWPWSKPGWGTSGGLTPPQHRGREPRREEDVAQDGAAPAQCTGES